MNKKNITILTILLILAFTGFSNADNYFKIGLEGGYSAPTDETFKEIYGSGEVVFGINAALNLSSQIEAVVAVDFYNADGETILSVEPASIKNTYLRFGGFYHFGKGGIDPKVGAGMEICFVTENSVFGKFSDSGIGWFISAGVDFPFGSKFIGSVEFLYSDITIEGDLGDQSVGGIKALAAIKYIL